MESEVLAERILLDLKNIFKKDPMIDEFDILPVNDSVCNKCPVIHVDHKIALESWCIRHVYLYAYSKFMKWRQRPSKIDSSSLLGWTSIILLINPDMDTAWNARKELIKSGQLAERDELRFSEVVLSRKPKSSQVFSHRKWVLLMIWNSSSSTAVKAEVIEKEFNVCTLTANRYPNNYYSWNHRVWILQHLLHFCAKVVIDELQHSEKWVMCHVSDYSGFHYRQFLLTCRNSEPSAAKPCPVHSEVSCKLDESSCFMEYSPRELCTALEQELLFLSKLQVSFPSHEALWNHRRFLVVQMASLPESAKQITSLESDGECASSKKYKAESDLSFLRDWNIGKEVQFANQLLQLSKNNAWELELISRHRSWLQKTGLCLQA